MALALALALSNLAFLTLLVLT